MDVHVRPIPPEPPFPNNRRFPLIAYTGVFQSPDDENPALLESLFESNGWTGSWRNGVYPFHHFHSTAHEVLGCYGGRGTIRFGGPDGSDLTVRAGDVVVVPAGVGHCLLRSSPDFRVVGAYPSGTVPDTLRGKAADFDVNTARSQEIPSPASDPVEGPAGSLASLWGAE